MGKDFVKRIALFFFAIQLASTVAFGQSILVPQQIWQQESSLNPAASGLYNKIDVFAGYSWLNDTYYETEMQSKAFVALANVYMPKLKSGLGISYNHYNEISITTDPFGYELNDTFNLDFSNIRLNYNYQFQFKNEHRLSFGTTLAIKEINWRSYDYPCWECIYDVDGADSEVGIGFGAMYAASNWYVGLSFSPVFVISPFQSSLVDLNLESSLIASYSFSLRGTTKFTPYIAVSCVTPDSYFEVSFVSLGFRITDEWFLFGVDLAGGYFTGSLNFNLGATLFKKLQLIYSPGLLLSNDAEFNAHHTFGLRYAMGK
jgi:hypothetical protein